MTNPNDVIVVVLKDIILCLSCLLVSLSLLSACLSVKLQWIIQVTGEIQGNS